MSKNKNKWFIYIVVLLVIVSLIFYLRYSSKSQEFKDYKYCVEDYCKSNFETCLNNNSLINTQIGKSNEPEDFLNCHWDYNFCIENCEFADWRNFGK